MPFKSQAQRRKFAELLVKGEISNETFEEWNRETGSKKLPERVNAQGRQESQRQETADTEIESPPPARPQAAMIASAAPRVDIPPPLN